MQNRVPVKREDRPALPDFTPVPRQTHRHDGWTPERQRAFIEALADTGCVSRAARQVNMAQANCYTLRRAPGAESFRAAWEAALDFGVMRLKDVAFERAIEGQLSPVFVAGKLMGFRRVRNDALLMFCLRHYGQDANGKRTTINYFSSRASARAGAGAASGAAAGASAAGGAAGAVAEARSMTMKTSVRGGDAEAAARIAASSERIEDFAGVELDDAAQAAIMAALADCAARRREADALMERGGTAARDAAEDDPDEPFVATPAGRMEHRGELEELIELEEWAPLVPDEVPWEQIGADGGHVDAADWVSLPPEPPEIVAQRARLDDARRIDPGVIDRSLPTAHKRRVKRARKDAG